MPMKNAEYGEIYNKNPYRLFLNVTKQNKSLQWST